MICTISKYRRVIILMMLPFLLTLLLDSGVAAQQKSDQEGKTSNVQWAMKDEVIIINYDLNGSPGAKYQVGVVMRKEGDSTFSVVPKTLEGDVGIGLFAGTSREIRWYYRRDFPDGFPGGGYYIEIEVTPVSSSNPWLYYGLGAAAVAGGLVVYLLTRSQSSTPPVVELPGPPGRP